MTMLRSFRPRWARISFTAALVRCTLPINRSHRSKAKAAPTFPNTVSGPLDWQKSEMVTTRSCGSVDGAFPGRPVVRAAPRAAAPHRQKRNLTTRTNSTPGLYGGNLTFRESANIRSQELKLSLIHISSSRGSSSAISFDACRASRAPLRDQSGSRVCSSGTQWEGCLTHAGFRANSSSGIRRWR